MFCSKLVTFTLWEWYCRSFYPSGVYRVKISCGKSNIHSCCSCHNNLFVQNVYRLQWCTASINSTICVSSNQFYQPFYVAYRLISKRKEHKNNTFSPKCCTLRDIFSILTLFQLFLSLSVLTSRFIGLHTMFPDFTATQCIVTGCRLDDQWRFKGW